MPFLMSPTIIAIMIAVVLQVATLGWGFVQSNRADHYAAKLTTCQADHAAFVKQTAAAGEIAKAKAKSTEDANRRTADETAKGWAAALDTVRADAARRVRLANTNARGSGVSAPTGTGQAPSTADADAIPAPERVASDCAETTLTANFLQRYIEDLK